MGIFETSIDLEKEFWNPDKLAKITDGTWLNKPDNNWLPEGICYTRKYYEKNKFIVCINDKNWKKGLLGIRENNISEFIKKGASGFIVEEDISNDIKHPILKVKNSRKALMNLAEYRRKNLEGKVICITGSVGKTSTKEILKFILEKCGNTTATRDNHNFQTGLAVSLAGARSKDDFVVLEVSASVNMNRLSKIVAPDIVVYTEISEAHLTQFKNLENIKKYKASLMDGLTINGVVVLNRDSDVYNYLFSYAKNRGIQNIITYGKHFESDIRIIETDLFISKSNITISYKNRIYNYSLGIAGYHNVMNSLASIATILKLNSKWEGLLPYFEKIPQVNNRLYVEKINKNYGQLTLINDAFNANPTSTKAAIDYLSAIPNKSGRKILVLGDMLELGDVSKVRHVELGNFINNSNIDSVFSIGDEMEYMYNELNISKKSGFYTTLFDLAIYLEKYLDKDDYVLIKGSHGSQISLISDCLSRKKSLEFLKSLKTSTMNKENSTVKKSNSKILNIKSSVVIDLHEGNIFLGERYNKLIYPASMTKIMTLLLIFERVKQNPKILNENIRIIKTTNTSWLLKEGDVISLNDAIKAIAIKSANEVASSIAVWFSGTESNFALEMTKKARNIGLQKTVFLNATGLHLSGHVSTAYDIAKLARYIIQCFPDNSRVFSLKSFTYNEKVYKNSNKLLGISGVNGFKTGRTPKSGFNLCSTGSSNDITYISVVVGRKSSIERDNDTLELFKNIYKNRNDYLKIENNNKKIYNINENEVILPNNSEQNILFLGDTYFGEYYDNEREKRGNIHYLKKYGYQYSFKNLTPLLADSDFTIANYEASLTQLVKSPFEGERKWLHNANPFLTLQVLQNYKIGAISLGNNHAKDFSNHGFTETLEFLEKFKYPYFGGGNNSNRAEKPLKIILPYNNSKLEVVIFSAYVFKKKTDEKFELYAKEESSGVANLNSLELVENIKKIKQRNKQAFIILQPHWGENYKWRSQHQTKLAQYFIEAGVDLIIGHGAHALQEIDRINDTWIINSIGNFIFNSHGRYKKYDILPFNFIASLKLTSVGNKKFLFLKLYPTHCDNPDTNFQSKHVNNEQFDQICNILEKKGIGFSFDDLFVKRDKDFFGHYISLFIKVFDKKDSKSINISSVDKYDLSNVILNRNDDLLVNSIKNAGKYLQNTVKKDGMFEYRVNVDPSIKIKNKYNILRHSGTIYSLVDYYLIQPDKELLSNIKKVGNYLITQAISSLPDNDNILAVWSKPEVNNGKNPLEIKLGANGLGLIALLSIEKIEYGFTSLDMLQKLGHFLVYMQKENGDFYSKYIPSLGGKTDKWISLYYPGEAALGLLMLYEIDSQNLWFDAAIKALLYLADQRKNKSDIPSDHWALLATEKLFSLKYKYNGEIDISTKLLTTHTIQICNKMLREQIIDPKLKKFYGGFSMDGSITKTSIRLEGLLAARKILDYQEKELCESIDKAVKKGVGFILDNQIKEGIYMGGFPRSSCKLNSEISKIIKFNKRVGEIRIDYVQHALSALIRYSDLDVKKIK